MDIVYASLRRRTRAPDDPASEVSGALSTLWAHATREDGLEHVSCRSGQDHIDFLMYLLTYDCGAPGLRSAVHRAGSLLRRCHAASTLMQRRYHLPPDVLCGGGRCSCAAGTPLNRCLHPVDPKGGFV